MAAKAQIGFDSWTTADGLPQNTISGIAQTPDGYLWLSTFDGLARFDGVRFTIFNKGTSRGIINNRFLGIFADRQGVIWAFTENGVLTVYRDGVFSSYETPEGANERIRFVREEPDGGIFIATIRKQYYFENGQFVPLPAAQQLAPGDTYFQNQKSVWIAGDSGMTHDLNGVKTFYPGQFDASSASTNYRDNVLEDLHGALWIGISSNYDLFRLHDGIVERFPVERIYGTRKLIHLRPTLEDKAGNIWLAKNPWGSDQEITDLVKFDGQNFQRYDAKGFWSGGLADREGNLWFTTLGNGLRRLQNRIISTVSAENGLRSNEIYPLIQTRSGDTLIGSVLGIDIYRDGKLTTLPKPQLMSGFWENANGEIYFSSSEVRLGKLAKTGKDFSIKNLIVRRLNSPGCTDFEDAGDGWMWLACEDGLIKFREGSPTETLTVADGLPHSTVVTLFKDRGGRLWIGTARGLAQLADGRFRSFTEAEGMPEDVIREIYEDADGTFWIGTYASGLVRCKDGKFFRITTENGLFNNGVFAIVEDERGNFWMTSNRGIYRVKKQQLNDLADGKIQRVESFSYGESDGMLNSEANGGRHPSAIKTADGKFWFPTMGGVAIVDPKVEVFNDKPPPVAIEDVLIDRKKLDAVQTYAVTHDPQKAVELQPGQSFLEIVYTGLSLVKSDQTKFKYRLEGFETEWIEAGTNRTAVYSYLPYGEYTFRVIAANADGVWNEQGATVKVVVIPHFYQTRWFLALSATAIILLGILIYNYRVSNLRKISAAKSEFSRRLIESQEAERKRIAGELHDSLSQNLVIIKNRAMMSLDERENAVYAFEQMEEIADAAGESLAEVREIASNLRPFQIDRLGLTKAIEALVRKANSPQLVVTAELDNIDKILSPETEINLYRILQESLNNIIKHSQATGAEIKIVKADSVIEVAIRDNGKGFDPNVIALKESGISGFGLPGIFERANIMNTVPVIESSPENGTLIRLKINY